MQRVLELQDNTVWQYRGRYLEKLHRGGSGQGCLPPRTPSDNVQCATV